MITEVLILNLTDMSIGKLTIMTQRNNIVGLTFRTIFPADE